MNEIERAKTFEKLIPDILSDLNLYEYEKVAIKHAAIALREKAERDKGCEYCNKEKDIKEFYENIAEKITYGHGYSSNAYHFHLFVNSSGILTLKGFNEWGTITRQEKINFCPWCGRKLKEVQANEQTEID